jgi:hypothetical protein
MGWIRLLEVSEIVQTLHWALCPNLEVLELNELYATDKYLPPFLNSANANEKTRGAGAGRPSLSRVREIRVGLEFFRWREWLDRFGKTQAAEAEDDIDMIQACVFKWYPRYPQNGLMSELPPSTERLCSRRMRWSARTSISFNPGNNVRSVVLTDALVDASGVGNMFTCFPALDTLCIEWQYKGQKFMNLRTIGDVLRSQGGKLRELELDVDAYDRSDSFQNVSPHCPFGPSFWKLGAPERFGSLRSLNSLKVLRVPLALLVGPVNNLNTSEERLETVLPRALEEVHFLSRHGAHATETLFHEVLKAGLAPDGLRKVVLHDYEWPVVPRDLSRLGWSSAIVRSNPRRDLLSWYNNDKKEETAIKRRNLILERK